MRAGKDVDPSKIAALDAIVEPGGPAQKVYRTLHSDKNLRYNLVSIAKNNGLWSDSGFMSTSRSADVAADFGLGSDDVRLNIRIPAGQPRINVPAGIYDQKEVVLPRNTTLRLSNPRSEGGVTVIDAVVVAAPKAPPTSPLPSPTRPKGELSPRPPVGSWVPHDNALFQKTAQEVGPTKEQHDAWIADVDGLGRGHAEPGGALNDFLAGDYRRVNAYLQDPNKPTLVAPGHDNITVQQQVSALDRAFAEKGMTTDQYRVFKRGVRSDEGFDPATFYTEGKTFVEPGFQSTALEDTRSFAGPDGWTQSIMVPPGYRYAYGTHNEREVVLDRNLPMRVIKVDPKIRHVWLEVDPPAGHGISDGVLDTADPPQVGTLDSHGLMESGGPMDMNEAFAARGITASGAVVAREGLPNRLQHPDRAVAHLLGDDGLGKTFDVLVASGTVSHVDLLATAVERSHEYRNVPAILASGEARVWARSLSDRVAADMLYYEAAEAFEEEQARVVVASARMSLHKRVVRGRVGRD